MSGTFSYFQVVLFVAYSTASLPTHAAVNTSATLSGFSWPLQDLTPEDGIPPSLVVAVAGGIWAAAKSYSTLFESHSKGGADATGDAGATASPSVATDVVGQLPLLTLSAQGATLASAPNHFRQLTGGAAEASFASKSL